MTLQMRPLGVADEPALRAFWAREPHAHIFAIPDLDYLGWGDPRLSFTGWFEGEALVGYLMLYGISAQWSFTSVAVASEIAPILRRRRVRFITGMEQSAWPVLRRLPEGVLERFEPSTVARLPLDGLRASTLRASPGRARQATVQDLEALAAVHVAAPDQSTNLDYHARRRALYAALTDGWRRVFLAETPDGRIAAAAQSSAEGRKMAVIGGVVTHPELRGQGYATVTTAALSAALITDGKVPFLFFRRDNVPAARVYRKIGFINLGDFILAELKW